MGRGWGWVPILRARDPVQCGACVYLRSSWDSPGGTEIKVQAEEIQR